MNGDKLCGFYYMRFILVYLDEMLFNAMTFLLFNVIAKFFFFLCVRRIELFFLFETHR